MSVIIYKMSEFNENIQIQQIAIRDAFRDKLTGKPIPYNDSSKRRYEKRPDLFILPLNYDLRQGEWKAWSYGRDITINYRRVKKNRDFIIMATDDVREVTYKYTSSENLDDQIRKTLAEMNADYNPNQRWTTDGANDDAVEWWVDNSLSLFMRGGERRGFAHHHPFGWTNYTPSGMSANLVQLQASVPQTLKPFNMVFNGRPINYRIAHIEYVDNESRCCWSYLRKNKIPMNQLKALKGNNADEWTFEELLRVAKAKHKILEIFDIDGDQFRNFYLKDGKVNFNETYRYFPPNRTGDGKMLNLRKGLAFMVVGNHIYPFHRQFQYSLLQSIGKGGKKYAKFNNSGEITDGDDITMSQRFIDTMPEGKKKEKLQEKYNKQVEEYSNSKYYEEGTFVIGEAKYNYYEGSHLDEVVRELYYNTNEIYNFRTDKNGNISQIWLSEYDEATNKPELVWRLQACPNYLLMKPLYEKFTMIYKGEDINTIGIALYQNVIGARFANLKSQTCGTIFKTEMPFNYTTEILDEHSKVNTYPAELQEYEVSVSIQELLRKQFLKDEEQRMYILSQQPEWKGQEDTHQQAIDEYMDTQYPMPEKPEPHGEEFCEEFGDVLCLDFNKFYSNRLENPHNPFMKFENFDNVEPYVPVKVLKNGFYYCEIPEVLESHEFIPFADKTAGWYCKSVVDMAFQLPKEKQPLITHQLIPHKNNIIPTDTFTKFVELVYRECEDLPLEHTAKSVINHFVGMLGRDTKEKVVVGSQLIRDTNDCNYAENKGYRLKPFAEARGEKEELYMTYKDKMSDERFSCLPIHIQILQEAKVELENLRRKIIANETEKKSVVYQEKPLSFAVWKHSLLARNWTKKWGFHPTKLDNGYRQYCKSLCKVEEKVSEKHLIHFIMFKTDSIVIADFGSGRLNEAIKDVDIGTGRGQLKIEWDTRLPIYADRKKLKNISKQVFKLKKTETEMTKTNHKYNHTYNKRDAVYDLIKDRKSFRVQGMGGTGKSSLMIGEHEKGVIPYMIENDIKFALCATTHKASHNVLFEKVGISGKTIDSLLGVCPSKPVPTDPQFTQLSGYDYIIIDEVSMLQKKFYNYLKQIKLTYPDLHFIFVGDYSQLPPVEPSVISSYKYDETNVLKWLCDYNLVELTKNMRSSAEGEEMFDWYKKLIVGETNPELEASLTKKYDLTTFRPYNKNLCWTKKGVHYVNWLVMSGRRQHYPSISNWIKLKPVKLNGKTIRPVWLKYGVWVGDRKISPLLELRATDGDKSGLDLYYNNQEFGLIDWVNDEASLECRVTKKVIYVRADQFYKHFRYNFATTIHKSQSDSYDEPYNIWEWDKIGDTRDGNALKYVAVSRTKAKKHINIITSGWGFPQNMPDYNLFKAETTSQFPDTTL